MQKEKGGSTKTGAGKVPLVYLTPSAYTPSPSNFLLDCIYSYQRINLIDFRMTSSEKLMAQIMGQKNRQGYLSEITELIPSNVSRVLDAGCAVGAISTLINRQRPLTQVVGLDLSRYMLTHQLKGISQKKMTLVQAIMPMFPFKSQSFDAVVAVQSLSEVLCFSGKDVLASTIEEIRNLLCVGGAFLVMDHQNPGDESIEVKINDEIIELMKRFQQSFEYRAFSFETLDDGWIKITLRDLYEFVTKAWSFDTDLEKEEMQETHTPFSGKEFADILEEHGFSIDIVTGLVPFENYLKRYKVRIRPKQNLPDRFFLLRAIKENGISQ